MFYKNNSSFQPVTMIQTWNIGHTVVTVLYSLALLFHCFFWVNMDVFDCFTRINCSISCIKQQSKNAALKLEDVHSYSCMFFPCRIFANTSAFCVNGASRYEHVTRERLITCADIRLDRSFLFTVITGISSKYLILMLGNISIQNHDSSISKKKTLHSY